MDHEYERQIVEGLIFASDTPITEDKITKCLDGDGLTKREIKGIVDELNSEYSRSSRAFYIGRVAGGFQLNTRKDLAPWIKKLFKGRMRPRLSHAALESLAIIVFKQPISRVEVDHIRGVNSGGVMKNLLERNLIAIGGRAEGPGKPLLYGTTKEFLRYIGVNHISDLPKPKEIEEIMGKLNPEEEVTENILKALTAVDDDTDAEIIESNDDATE